MSNHLERGSPDSPPLVRESPDSPSLPPDAPSPRTFNVTALLILICVAACVTAADLLLKRGAKDTHETAGTGLLAILGITALASPFTIAGICCHLAGLAAWVQALRRIPLTIAYCFTAVQQATIALGAWLWLGETISPVRWLGIFIVMCGVVLLVPSIVSSSDTETRTATPRQDGAA